jgi:hypothetical protein
MMNGRRNGSTMSGVTLPVTRPIGRALIVGSAACRSGPQLIAQQVGYQCASADDPYGAMAELCRRPLVYRAVILSLASVYREELQIVPTLKRRFPHLEIWLAHTDGRGAALAEASRLGADGLLAEDGLHRFAATSVAQSIVPAPRAQPMGFQDAGPAAPGDRADDPLGSEAVLTADELKALLAEQPARPADEASP